MKKFIKILKTIFKILTFALLVILSIGFIATSCDKKEQTASADTYSNLQFSDKVESGYNHYEFTILSGDYEYFAIFYPRLNSSWGAAIVDKTIIVDFSSIKYLYPSLSCVIRLNNADIPVNTGSSIYLDNFSSYILFIDSSGTIPVGTLFKFNIYMYEGDITQSDYSQGYLIGKADGIKDSITELSIATAGPNNTRALNGTYKTKNPVDPSVDIQITYKTQLTYTDNTVTATYTGTEPFPPVTIPTEGTAFIFYPKVSLVAGRTYKVTFDNITTQSYLGYQLVGVSYIKDGYITQLGQIDNNYKEFSFQINENVEALVFTRFTTFSIDNLKVSTNELLNSYDEGFDAGNIEGYNRGFGEGRTEGYNAG
ncbi:MAG: hypothetical protein MJ066_05375, partial [Clostridia bacterium]|nr:hypothetical protein [Clostridia bacterium]